MTVRTANILRLVALGLLGVVVVLALRVLNPPDPVQAAKPRGGEVSVSDALNQGVGKPMAVRGYVFEGPGGLGLRVCNGRKPGSPPSTCGLAPLVASGSVGCPIR